MNRFNRLLAMISGLGSQITSPITTGCIAWILVGGHLPTLAGMEPLPPDFAKQLALVIAPGDEGAAAEVIQAATRLDDERLGDFLNMLAERIRASAAPITRTELRTFLRLSTKGGRPA
jgi:hypothetical protein